MHSHQVNNATLLAVELQQKLDASGIKILDLSLEVLLGIEAKEQAVRLQASMQTLQASLESLKNEVVELQSCSVDSESSHPFVMAKEPLINKLEVQLKGGETAGQVMDGYSGNLAIETQFSLHPMS